jgi:16S rRNA (guanine527-N7)-methyltransferase
MTDVLRADLAARYDLDAGQMNRLEVVLNVIGEDVHAPTSVRDPAEAADVHVADSLAGLDVDRLRTAPRIADLGAGAGFPGVVLAVALPVADVRLVESQRRKCEFLERLCDEAEIENTSVVWARAEEWLEGLTDNDAVVARALASQAVVLEYAAPLLTVGGVLVDWRGRREPEEERSAADAAGLLGMRLLEIRKVEPFAGAREHHLHVFEKVTVTPERFPRRAGMARKRPLSS